MTTSRSPSPLPTLLMLAPLLWPVDGFPGTALADLAVTKAGPASVTPGQTISYTITVVNDGPDSATSVVVGDATPSGLAFLSNAGDCTTPFPCALGAIGAGQSRAITATFSVPSGYSGPSPISNTATVAASSADPTAANNSSTASTPVAPPSADLVIVKIGPLSYSLGTTLTYMLIVSNLGPSDAADIVVDDPTPPGLIFASNTGACFGPFPCRLGGLPGGHGGRTIMTTFAVPSDYSGPDPILNTASVSSAIADPDPTNDSATASTPRPVPTTLHTVTPCRLVDTRGAIDPWGGPALEPGGRGFPLVGRCGIPTTARALSVNLTVTGATAPGHLRIHPPGTVFSLISTINYSAGQTRANNAIIALGAAGDIDVRCHQQSGTVHFILDVAGWFE